MSENEKHMGEDGLDLADTEAVLKWCDQKKAEHDEWEKKLRERITNASLNPDEHIDFDISKLPDEIASAMSEIMGELDQREANFRSKLDEIGTGGHHGTSAEGKWAKL